MVQVHQGLARKTEQIKLEKSQQTEGWMGNMMPLQVQRRVITKKFEIYLNHLKVING